MDGYICTWLEVMREDKGTTADTTASSKLTYQKFVQYFLML